MNASTQPLLRVQDLSQAYGNRKVLRDINLDLPYGALIALTGANGAGKTTLLKVLAGLYRPLSGSLEWDWQNQGVSLFIPESSLYASLTLRENLSLYSKLYEVSLKQNAHLIDAFGLHAFLDEPVGHLSRGQKHRGALARTFLKPASLYLLDEPFTGLDEKGNLALKDYIKRLKGTGRTVVLAIHELAPIREALDLKLTLDSGRLQ